MHRREGENVRKRGWENAWRSEKGERRRIKHIHMREKGMEGGVKRRKYKCIRQKDSVTCTYSLLHMARERFRCIFERKKETGWREQRKKFMRARIMKERGFKRIRK